MCFLAGTDKFSLQDFGLVKICQKGYIVKAKIKSCLGVVLNSMNSVLSFNNLNLNFILGKKTGDEHLHESSFLKQSLYYFLFFCFKIG